MDFEAISCEMFDRDKGIDSIRQQNKNASCSQSYIGSESYCNRRLRDFPAFWANLDEVFFQ